MIDFDVTALRITAVKALGLVVAIRRLGKPIGLDSDELLIMEREFRFAAAEMQRVEKLMLEGVGKSGG